MATRTSHTHLYSSGAKRSHKLPTSHQDAATVAYHDQEIAAYNKQAAPPPNTGFKKTQYSSTAKVFIGGAGTVLGMLAFISILGSYGFAITDWQGNPIPAMVKCAGNAIEPCIQQIMVCATSNWSLAFSSTVSVGTNVSQGVKAEILKNGQSVDWTKETIPAGQCRFYELSMEKPENASVKWDFSTGLATLDPVFEGYVADDFVSQLVYSEVTGPTGGEAVFIFRNPTSVQLSLSALSASLIGGGSVDLYDVSNRTETMTKRVRTDRLDPVQAQAGKNGSLQTLTGYVTRYDTVQEVRMVYDFLNKLTGSEGVNPGETKLIGVRGRWKARTGKTAKDWQPSFTLGGSKFTQAKLAWWNTSYNFKLPVNITGIASVTNFSVDYWYPINDSSVYDNLTDVAVLDPSETFELDMTSVAKNNTHMEIVFMPNITSGANYTYYIYYNGTGANANNILNRSVRDHVNLTNASAVVADRYFLPNYNSNTGGTVCNFKENTSVADSEGWNQQATTSDFATPRVGWYASGEIRFLSCNGGTATTVTDGFDNSTFANRTVTGSGNSADWSGEFRFYPDYWLFTLYSVAGANANYTVMSNANPLGSVGSNTRMEVQNGTSVGGASATFFRSGADLQIPLNYTITYDTANGGRAFYAVLRKAYANSEAIPPDGGSQSGTSTMVSQFGIFDTTKDNGSLNSTGTIHRLANRTGNIFYGGLAPIAEARNRSMLLANDSTLNITLGGTADVSSPVPPSINLYINGSGSDNDTEMWQAVNITANVSPPGLQVCLSANAPDLGDNFTCAATSVSYIWQRAQSGINSFNDSTTAKNFTFGSLGNSTAYLWQIRNGSIVTNAFVNLTGYQSSSAWPKNVKIDLDGNESNDTVTWGNLTGTNVTANEFNDTNTRIYFNRTSVGTGRFYIRQPKSVNVSSVRLNLSGNQTNASINMTDLANVVNLDLFSMAWQNGSDIIYIFGGTNGTNVTGGDFVLAYNVRIGNVTQKAQKLPDGSDLNIGRDSCAVYSPEAQSFYVLGGGPNLQQNLDNRVFNTSNESWVEGPANMPYEVNGGACLLHADGVFLVGGIAGASISTVKNTTLIYNITTNSWNTTHANMTTRSWRGHLENLNSTHFIYYGGEGVSDFGVGGVVIPSRNVSVYDFQRDEWNLINSSFGLNFTNPESNGDPHLERADGFKIGGSLYIVPGPNTTSTGARSPIFIYNESNAGAVALPTSSPNISHRVASKCAEVNHTAYCIGPNIARRIEVFPKGISLFVGNATSAAFSNTSYYADRTTVTLTTAINDYLQTCSAPSGYCDVPVSVNNGAAGIITIDALEQNNTLRPFQLNLTNKKATCSASYCNKTVTIWSDSAGIVQVDGINVTFNGTSQVNITADTPGNASYLPTSFTRYLNIYWSNFSKNLPYSWTPAEFFLPPTNDSKNVTPFGQTNVTPIFSLNGSAQDKAFNVSLKWDNTLVCLNLAASNTSNITNAINVSNTTSNFTCRTSSPTGNCSVWHWLNLTNCNGSANKYTIPNLTWQSCCSTCMACW